MEPQLGEVDRTNAENYLATILPLFRLLGVSAFTPVTEAVAVPGNPVEPIFNLIGQTTARGQEVPDGFAVFEASAALEAKPGLPKASSNVREHLLASGILIPEGDHLRLSRPYIFTSPSAAGSVVRGYAVGGRTEWKDEDGITLKEHQEQILTGETEATQG